LPKLTEFKHHYNSDDERKNKRVSKLNTDKKLTDQLTSQIVR